MSSLEERIERLEKLIRLVIKRLEEIEKILLRTNREYLEVYRIASSLIFTFSLPISKALEIAMKVLEVVNTFRLIDEITISIIEVLMVKDKVSISELTRLVRRIRGKASRRIIIDKVKKLEELGLVKVERKCSRTWVSLNV